MRLIVLMIEVDAVVVHVDVSDQPFAEVVRQIREIGPKIPIIALSPTENPALDGVN